MTSILLTVAGVIAIVIAVPLGFVVLLPFTTDGLGENLGSAEVTTVVYAINVALVRQALNTPGNNWPKPLIPLMEQLAVDWPKLGALAAATRMAAAANAEPAPGPAPARWHVGST